MQFNKERDILRIAYALFEAETTLKKTGRIKRITIPLSRETFLSINKIKLKKLLKELFLLILIEDVQISFKKINDTKGRVKKEMKFPSKEAIALFSGGVDSYAGIKVSENQYKNLLGLFVAHSDQGRIVGIVNRMKQFINTEIKTIYAPPMGSLGYSQLRGFLYILSAGVYLKLCKADKILITECGPTMYQPLFSPYDSITFTTHPYVLKIAMDVLEIMLGFTPKLVIPFENLTKAEVMFNSGIKDYSKTHSCVSQRFGDHDGTCFGCVIRKLAGLVTGIKDVRYNNNVFDLNNNQDNLINLLDYSKELLINFNSMPSFQTDKINEFEKYNLFKRYAEDNLAGVMIGVNRKDRLYSYVSGIEKLLKKRILDVRKKTNKPDFNNYVK
jgi:hypothetical protein